MLTKAESKKLKKLIKAHVQTSLDASWAGALPSEERGPIHAEERKATLKLMEYIREIEAS